jgi:hypothetical protein
MKAVIPLLVSCLLATASSGRSVNAMTYQQMLAAADSVFIGRVVRVEPVSEFENPKEFGKDAKLRCFLLTVKVHCMLKGPEQSMVQIRSYDYQRSGDPKTDFLLDVNAPEFLSTADHLMKTDSLWFLRRGEPVTGQMDASLSVIVFEPNYLTADNWPNKAAEPTRTTVTPPADAGDRASGARGSP